MAIRARNGAAVHDPTVLRLHIAVAIVGYRSAADIARCVAALAASTHTDFEVVICENGGAQAYRDLVAAIPSRLAGGQTVRAMDAGANLGFAGGVNRCLAASPSARAWWLLNPDTEPHPDAMAALVARLEAGDCDAVGGKIHSPDGRLQTYGGRWQPWLARAVSLGRDLPLEANVDAAWVERTQNYLSGASMLVGRRFVDLAGPMREDYFLYCEEVEWCLRAQVRGARLGFAPTALISHIQGATTGAGASMRDLPRLPVYLNERNRILLTRDRSPGRVPVAAMAALMLIFLRYGRRGAWRQLGYGLGGWRAGMFNRRGADF